MVLSSGILKVNVILLFLFMVISNFHLNSNKSAISTMIAECVHVLSMSLHRLENYTVHSIISRHAAAPVPALSSI